MLLLWTSPLSRRSARRPRPSKRGFSDTQKNVPLRHTAIAFVGSGLRNNGKVGLLDTLRSHPLLCCFSPNISHRHELSSAFQGTTGALACCRFQRHLVRCMNETG